LDRTESGIHEQERKVAVSGETIASKIHEFSVGSAQDELAAPPLSARRHVVHDDAEEKPGSWSESEVRERKRGLDGVPTRFSDP
jgi:hypothetical protein